jgi:hypothetical protein
VKVDGLRDGRIETSCGIAFDKIAQQAADNRTLAVVGKKQVRQVVQKVLLNASR